jgi:hypothetical protein
MKTIHNVETGEITQVELSEEDIAFQESGRLEIERRQAEAEAKEAAKNDILTRLGITAEEAALLLK